MNRQEIIEAIVEKAMREQIPTKKGDYVSDISVGLEAKKLREALENIQWLDEMTERQEVIGRCPECESENKHGHMGDCKTGKALSREKSSYEQEARLMEAVVKSANYTKATGIKFIHPATGKDGTYMALEALNKFREEK